MAPIFEVKPDTLSNSRSSLPSPLTVIGEDASIIPVPELTAVLPVRSIVKSPTILIPVEPEGTEIAPALVVMVVLEPSSAVTLLALIL